MSDRLKKLVQSELVEAGITKGFQQAVEKFRDEQMKLDKLRDEQDELVSKFKKASPKDKEKLKKDLISMHKKVKTQQKNAENAERFFNKALQDEPEDLEMNEASVPSKISVIDERHVGKYVIVVLQDDKTSEMNTVVVPKNKVNKYNRNDKGDVETLWRLGKEFGTKPIKESSQLSENFSRSDVDKIKDIVKNTDKLVKLRDPLKQAGFRNVDFSFSPVPHFTIKKGRSKYVILNKKYADDADWTIGSISGGILEGVTTEGCNECGDSLNESISRELAKSAAGKLGISSQNISVGGGFTPKKTKDGNYIVVLSIDKDATIKDPHRSLPKVDWKEVERYFVVKSDATGGFIKLLDTFEDRSDIKLQSYVNENRSVDDKIEFWRNIKVGDKVKYHGKPKNGFKTGGTYEVDNFTKSSTMDKKITIKNGGKKLTIDATRQLGPVNEAVERGNMRDDVKKVIDKVRGFSTVQDDGVLKFTSPSHAETASDKLNDTGIAASSKGKYVYLESVNEAKVELKVGKHPTKSGYTIFHNKPGFMGAKGNHIGWYKKKSDAESRKKELMNSKSVNEANDFGMKYSKQGHVKFVPTATGKRAKKVSVDGKDYKYNPTYKTYNSVKDNELLHKNDIEKANKVLREGLLITEDFGITAMAVMAGVVGGHVMNKVIDKVSPKVKDKIKDFNQTVRQHKRESDVQKAEKIAKKLFDDPEIQSALQDDKKSLESNELSKLLQKKLSNREYKHLIKVHSELWKKHWSDQNTSESVNEAKDPKTIEQLRKIVDTKSMGKVDGTRVDLTTANVVVKVYDALNSTNQKKFGNLPLDKMINVAWKMVK